MHSSLIGTSYSVSVRSPLPSPSNKVHSVASISLPLVRSSTKGDSVTNKEEGVSSSSTDKRIDADGNIENVRPFIED